MSASAEHARVGRHRHAINVRTDGLVTVLGPLLRDRRIVAAVLADVGSGMVLDAWSRTDGHDTELVGGVHAEIVRSVSSLMRPDGRAPGDGCEVVLAEESGGRHHVLRAVPDAHDDLLVLSVVVDGSAWAVRRVRRRLREVSAAALTAEPTTARRPVEGVWRPSIPARSEIAIPAAGPREEPVPGDGVDGDLPAMRWFSADGPGVVRPRTALDGAWHVPAPPSALPPSRTTDRSG